MMKLNLMPSHGHAYPYIASLQKLMHETNFHTVSPDQEIVLVKLILAGIAKVKT